MRAIALFLLIFCATPLVAQTSEEPDMLPVVSHDIALSCLAQWVSDIEANGAENDPVSAAKELVYFSRIIAQTATADEAASYDSLFAEKLNYYRSLRAALNNPETRDEADMDLTGSAKMCWFQALTVEGGPYEGQ